MTSILTERVLAAEVTESGTLVTAQRGRIRALYVRDTATDGTAVFRDGGASGTIILTLNTPGAKAGDYIQVPGGGISFASDLHVTLTDVSGVTVFYAEDRA